MSRKGSDARPALQYAVPDVGEEVRAPDVHWAGRPVYRCQRCPYERVENLAAVLRHEAEAHKPAVRESQILGPAGETMLVQGPKE